MSAFGLGGFPSALLVDPSGLVVWKGHPGNLKGSDIEERLGAALKTPLFDWPDEAKSARKAFAKGQMKKALEAARDVEAGDLDIAAEIQAVITGKIAALRAASERGDYLGVLDLGDRLKKELSGLPEGDEAKGLIDAVKDQDDFKAVVKAQKKIAKLREEVGELRKKDDADDILEDLREIMEDHPGTYAYEEAKELSAEVSKMKADLR